MNNSGDKLCVITLTTEVLFSDFLCNILSYNCKTDDRFFCFTPNSNGAEEELCEEENRTNRSVF
jgi:hypothetical protein